MKKIILSLIALLTAFGMGLISGCSNLERYRYACQDPVNWEKDECKPPICEASGTCPIDIYGSLPNG